VFRDNFSDLCAIGFGVKAVITIAPTRYSTQSGKPFQVWRIRRFEGLWIGQDHIHRLAEALEIEFKLGTDIIRRK
jgi:hypothetical protein